MTNASRTGRIKALAAVAAAAFAVTGGVVVGFAGPASASDGVCNSEEWCVWEHFDGTGGIADFTGSHRNYQNTGYINSSSRLNDSVSSVRNRGTTHYIRAYKAAEWRGDYWNYPNNGVRYNVGQGFNDTFSSHQWYRP